MKVYTIFTGGTIGSRMNKSGRITAEGSSAPRKLLALYRQKYSKDIEFVVDEPYCILSENLAAENILCLLKSVNRALKTEDIDGVVITHGTDTLQYSAALLGYIFGSAKLPIMFVSAAYTLDDTRSNGLENFRYALEFIRGKLGRGVFVSYCNQGQSPVIHRGTRLLQHLPFSADITSVGDAWYGRFEEGRYIQNPDYVVRDGLEAMFEDTAQVKLAAFSDQVMRIFPYAGMSYPAVPAGVKAVLHESFHSGTIAVSEELKAFAAEADRLSIPIFLTGLSEREKEYETVDRYRELGIRPLCESAPIAQYCKLWLAVSNGMSPESIMNVSVAEDFICP